MSIDDWGRYIVMQNHLIMRMLVLSKEKRCGLVNDTVKEWNRLMREIVKSSERSDE